MRSQPIVLRLFCSVVVVVVVVVVVFVVVVAVDGGVVVVDGGGWLVVCKVIFVSNPTQLSLVEVVLRLRWGCDNKSLLMICSCKGLIKYYISLQIPRQLTYGRNIFKPPKVVMTIIVVCVCVIT